MQNKNSDLGPTTATEMEDKFITQIDPNIKPLQHDPKSRESSAAIVVRQGDSQFHQRVVENQSWDSNGDRAMSKHTYNESDITKKVNDEVVYRHHNPGYVQVKRGKRAKRIKIQKNNDIYGVIKPSAGSKGRV